MNPGVASDPNVNLPPPPIRLHVRPPQSTVAHRRTLRELVRAACENRPGVYRMLGATGAVIYVGQSRVLRTRLLSYFRARGRRDKSARILRHAFNIEWEYTPTDFGALLRELRLIKQYRPHFNRMLVTDEWPRGYIALTGGAVPGIRVVPKSDHPGAVAMFGPFRKVRDLREAVRVLADFTGMRDCTLEDRAPQSASRLFWHADDARAVALHGTTSRRVPGCLRRDLGTCSGPCVGGSESVMYDSAVQQARAFLEGLNDEVVTHAQQRMLLASERLEFEYAASLRDRIERLAWLRERLQRFHASVDRLTFRYHALTRDGHEHVYFIRRGTVRAEFMAPQSTHERAQFEQEAERVFRPDDPRGDDVPLHDLDEFHLVASWFRRRPQEKSRTHAP